MRSLKRYLGVLSLATILFIVPMKADAMGWENVDDGWAAIDSNGCLVHIHTQEWNFLWITWDTRTVVDVVWCPE